MSIKKNKILKKIMCLSLLSQIIFYTGCSSESSESLVTEISPSVNEHIPIPVEEFIASAEATTEVTIEITEETTNVEAPKEYENIEFGGYTWKVLEKNEDSMLVITEEVIDLRTYHDIAVSITWEDCTLRSYLNNEFYNSFNETDRARIKDTNLINDNNPKNETPGGNNTTDKIFLLSIDEAEKYFHSWLKDGVATLSSDAAIKYYEDANRAGEPVCWWLRSPGTAGFYAAEVSASGWVSVDGTSVRVLEGGVRPALYLEY